MGEMGAVGEKNLVEEDVSDAANLVELERLDGAPSRPGVLAPERHEGLAVGAWGARLPRRAKKMISVIYGKYRV